MTDEPNQTLDPPSEILESSNPRFQFVRRIGHGVIGDAYEVLDEVRGEPVVLKVFRRCQPKKTEHFRMEFEAISRLAHDNLVPVYHLIDPNSDTNIVVEERVGEQGLAFTREFVAGVPLSEFLSLPADDDELAYLEAVRRPATRDFLPDSEDVTITDSQTISVPLTPVELPLDVDDVASEILEELSQIADSNPIEIVLRRIEALLPDIVSGLSYLHRFHRVHGNLRPSNILITKDNRALLVDYAITHELAYEGTGDAVSLLEAPENLPYLAPEFESEMIPTPEMDAYALGCVLFEAIAGHSPFEALEWDPTATGSKLRPPPLAEHVPECPTSWAEIVDGLLRDEPDDRQSLESILQIVVDNNARPVVLRPTPITKPGQFIGYGDAMKSLSRLAKRVSADHSMHLCITAGDTGCGKTSVLDQFSHWLSRRGWLVFRGTCFNREEVAHQGWIDIAKQVATILKELPLGYREIHEPSLIAAARMFPELHPAPSESATRDDAVRALRFILKFLGEQRPVLIVIDDFHWSSWDVETLLVDLFANPDGVRVLACVGWATDVTRAKTHRFHQDLKRALLPMTTLDLHGIDTAHADEFDRLYNLESEELTHAAFNPAQRIASQFLVTVNGDETTQCERLTTLWTQIFDATKSGERAVYEILALVSGRLTTHDVVAIARAHDGGVTEVQIVDAIDRLLTSGFVVERDGLYLRHDFLRRVVSESMTEEQRVSVLNKIAGQFRESDSARCFEYQHRAGHVSKATQTAVQQARTAETRFATHRAAKIWRWFLDNADRLPGAADIDPRPELARVEYVAERYMDAAFIFADLFRENATPTDGASAVVASLRAGDAITGEESCHALSQTLGMTYRPSTYFQSLSVIRRARASFARLNAPAPEHCKGNATTSEREQCEHLFRVVRWDRWMLGTRGFEFAADLALRARRLDDNYIWGLARLAFALTCFDTHKQPKRRVIDWLKNARPHFADSPEFTALTDAYLSRALVLSNDKVSLPTNGAMDDFDETFAAATAMQLRGDYEEAQRTIERLLHRRRYDALATFRAYSALGTIALRQGRLEACEIFYARADEISIRDDTVLSILRECRNAPLRIAKGEPDVAAGRLRFVWREQQPVARKHNRARMLLRLRFGQSLAAWAGLQRSLGSRHASRSVDELTKIIAPIAKYEFANWPMVGAELLRLQVRTHLLNLRVKRARKTIERGIESLSTLRSVEQCALILETHGHTLNASGDERGPGMISDAHDVYTHVNINHPLILEGWPIPEHISSLSSEP